MVVVGRADEGDGAVRRASEKRCLSLFATMDCSSASVTCSLRSLCQASCLSPVQHVLGALAWEGE